jgi:hypothetical protein
MKVSKRNRSQATMWIPESLYKLLPVIYAMAGSAVYFIFGLSGPGLASAGALFMAAALTALWRFTHQAPTKKAPLSARDEWEQRRGRRTESMSLESLD